MVFKGFRKLAKCLRLKLSGVVGILATGIALVHEYIIKRVLLNRILSQSTYTVWLCRPIDVCAWHAVCVGYAVSIASSSALATKTTWLLGKREDGSMDPFRYYLGYSYQLGIQTKLYLERTYGDEPPFDEIIPTLFLGAWPADESLLPATRQDQKIVVVDVTCELPCRVGGDIDGYHLVPVWDSHAASPDQIQRAVTWAMPYARDPAYLVYIHCAHGHGRSGTVMGAMLIAMGEVDSVDEAIACMKQKRPLVRLNTRQRDALVAWSKSYS